LDAGDVIFRLDGRLIRLTSVEANEIHGRLVKLSEGREKLRSQLTQALRHDSQERAVVVDDEAMRQELLPCLEAIEQAGRMTPGLRELREAASTPIT
jgi:predicted glycosyltransferase